MFNLKVEEVETGKTLVDEKNLTGTILAFTTSERCKFNILTDCKGGDIVAMYVSLRHLVNEMENKYSMLKALDAIGVIDVALSQVNTFTEYDTDEDNVPVIQFPRKYNEKP